MSKSQKIIKLEQQLKLAQREQAFTDIGISVGDTVFFITGSHIYETTVTQIKRFMDSNNPYIYTGYINGYLEEYKITTDSAGRKIIECANQSDDDNKDDD